MKTTLNQKRNSSRQMNFLKCASLGVLSLLIAGCPAGQQSPQSPAPAASGKVVIKGSNTIGEELAPRLVAEYKKDHATAVIEIESKGTAYGFGNLLAGGCDIAAASRAANENELQLARDRGIELNDYVIGSYSVAVIVNPASPVGNLTKEQVRDIFAGTIKNWQEVGGPDASITLCVRDPISGTHLGFREVAMENKPYASTLKTFTSYAGIVQAVAQDANSIGYTSIQMATNAGVKAVAVAGVAPSVLSVNKGQYPFSRGLRFYTRKANETPETKAFIEFVRSPRGQGVENEMGVVPQP